MVEYSRNYRKWPLKTRKPSGRLQEVAIYENWTIGGLCDLWIEP